MLEDELDEIEQQEKVTSTWVAIHCFVHVLIVFWRSNQMNRSGWVGINLSDNFQIGSMEYEISKFL
jgi:hypothetical protein